MGNKEKIELTRLREAISFDEWIDQMRDNRLDFLGSNDRERLLIGLAIKAAERWGDELGCGNQVGAIWLVLTRLGMKIVPVN